MDLSEQKQYAERLDEIRKAVDSDITLAWGRKTSLETRAAAIVTANLAVVTLFFLLNRELGYILVQSDGWPRTVVVVALTASGISVIAAALSVMLLNYPGLDGEAYREAILDAADPTQVDTRLEVLEARVEIYDGAVRANRRKTTSYAIGFVSWSTATVLYSVALILSALMSS